MDTIEIGCEDVNLLELYYSGDHLAERWLILVW